MYLMRRTMMVDLLLESAYSMFAKTQERSFAKHFLGYLASDMTLAFVLFLLGSSVYGARFVYPLMFLKAAGCSTQACLFVQNCQPQGIGPYYLCLFPSKCLLLFALLIMGQNSIYTSEEIKKTVREQGSENKRVMSMFALRSVIAAGILALSDLLSAAMPMLFRLLFPQTS